MHHHHNIASNPFELTITGGETYRLSNAHLTGASITVDALPPNWTSAMQQVPTTLTLSHVTLDDTSVITLVSEPWKPNLEIAGATVNNGTITTGYNPIFGGRLTSSTSEIDIGQATFINNGTILGERSGVYFGQLNIVGQSRCSLLVNNGSIDVWESEISVRTIGRGSIAFLPTVFSAVGFTEGRLGIDDAVGAGEKIDFTNDGSLTLSDLGEFKGTIVGFTGPTPTPISTQFTRDMITLPGHDVTGISYHGDAEGGVLVLSEGRTRIGAIRFAGAYTQSQFNVGHFDDQGEPTTYITLS